MSDVRPRGSDRASLRHMKAGGVDVGPVAQPGRPEQSPLRIEDAEPRHEQRMPRIFAASLGGEPDPTALEADDVSVQPAEPPVYPLAQTTRAKLVIVQAEDPLAANL